MNTTLPETGQVREPVPESAGVDSATNSCHQDTPTIDIHPVPSPTISTSPGLSQPSFRDNQFESDSLQNGTHAIVPGDRHSDHLGLLAGPGRTLSYKRPARLSVSGSEDDPSEGIPTIKTIKTVNELGFSASERPGSSSMSQNETDDNAVDINPADNNVALLWGVEGAGSGLSWPDVDHRQMESDLSLLGPDQTSSNLTVERMAIRIRDSTCKSDIYEDHFFPADALDNLINEHNVRHLLINMDPRQTEQQISSTVHEVMNAGSEILPGRRRIFATLILMESLEKIFDFIKAKVYDFDLPLKFDWIKKMNKFEVYNASGATLLDCCKAWRFRDISLFQIQQMVVMAPVFHQPEDNLQHYNLTDKTILPYLEHNHKTCGGYGNVYKVKIHPAHYKFLSPAPYMESDPYFAVKALDVSKREQFRDEVDILKRFSIINNPHSHLIQLLLTYQHRDNYYLMFHWAQSNLKDYWRDASDRARTPETFVWFMKQCVGIVSGLQQIHRVRSGGANLTTIDDKNYGRHGDIKPENILCFGKDGDIHLVITDFGLSRYHSHQSVSQSRDVKGFSGTYRPPECDSPKSISQRYDMWTLGCLFLEFVSWLVLGNDETETAFARARVADDEHPDSIYEDKFFNFNGKKEAKVKDSVSQWILKIRNHGDCPLFVHEMLDLVENHLLIPDSKKRSSCSQVRQELYRIMEFLNSSFDSTKEIQSPSSTTDRDMSIATGIESNVSKLKRSPSRCSIGISQRGSELSSSSSTNHVPIYSEDTTPSDTQTSSDPTNDTLQPQILSSSSSLHNKQKVRPVYEPEGDVLKSAAELDDFLKGISSLFEDKKLDILMDSGASNLDVPTIVINQNNVLSRGETTEAITKHPEGIAQVFAQVPNKQENDALLQASEGTKYPRLNRLGKLWSKGKHFIEKLKLRYRSRFPPRGEAQRA